MAVIPALPTELRLRCDIILHKHFGVSTPAGLTSAEKYRAYERIKSEMEMTARSLKNYEQDIQYISDYLQL